MASFFQFLPLFFWAIVGFGGLYTLLETKTKPISVIFRSAGAAAQIIVRHPRIALALLALFIGTRLVEALIVFGLELRGQSLIYSGLAWQAVSAAAIAWIATHIHGLTLPPIARDEKATRRYRIVSAMTGLGIFLATVLFSILSSLALQGFGLAGHFGSGFWVRLLQILLFVPLALIRPALSFGEKNPVGAAFMTAARSPIVLGVWVTLLSLPALFFDIVSGDVLRAHQSVKAAMLVALAKAAFNVAAFTFFETTTLLLFARSTQRLNFGRHVSIRDIVSGAGVQIARVSN
jgi:hypothetical protein